MPRIQEFAVAHWSFSVPAIVFKGHIPYRQVDVEAIATDYSKSSVERGYREPVLRSQFLDLDTENSHQVSHSE